MRYRKKPVVIDAIQFTKDSKVKDLHNFCGDNVTFYADSVNGLTQLDIHTLEGTMTANLNDYIIKGVKGELYPCKPDIFEQTYEKVE